MNLYLISQTKYDDYDTYDSAVVVAESEEAAKLMHPSGGDDIRDRDGGKYAPWVNDPKLVTAKFIGFADSSIDKPTVICSSYNAG